MKIYTVYKATNIVNNKSYIGFDSNWPCRRNMHKYNALKKQSPNLFHRAIRKHGFDFFSWEILYQSQDREHTLKEMEPYFVKEYDAKDTNGYNLTEGGEGGFGFVHTEEVRQKLSNLAKGNKRRIGKKHSPETIQKFKIPKSEEHKRKLSIAITGKKLGPLSKEHIQKLSGENNHFYGKHHSEETKNKLREQYFLRKSVGVNNFAY